MLWYCCIIGVADILPERLAMGAKGCKGRPASRAATDRYFSICYCPLFWQRGVESTWHPASRIRRMTLICNGSLAAANSPFDYAHSERSEISPAHLPIVWESG